MMKLIVFAVEQGLCAYVRTPNDYGVLIDCGSSGSGIAASPADWLAEHEAPSLNAAISLVVTHPHENHVKGVGNVTRLLSPSVLRCDSDFDWPAVSESKPNVEAYRSWMSNKAHSVPATDFGAEVQCFSLNRQEAEEVGGDADHVINNRSVVTIVSYTSAEGYAWKVVIAGDNRADGWEALLAKPEFCAAVKGADFFVTSSHGQESGFCADLFKIIGKPLANISCKSDGRVDARYKKTALGVKFPDGSRSHFITPDDGNITVEMRDDGRFDVWLFRP